MKSAHKSLLNAARALALIGLLSLSFTQEISGLWLQIAWCIYMVSFLIDRYPQEQRRLRRWETAGVGILVAITLLDIGFFRNSIFVVLSHFLLIFQSLKGVGLKERKDCVQIGLIGFFQLLAACTLSADIEQAVLLIALIPVATALLYWNHAARISEEAIVHAPWPDAALKKLHRGISLSALPLNMAMTAAVFLLFPRLTFNVHVPGFGAGRSAYTDHMNLAQSGTLTQDSTAAAWMGFADEPQRRRWNYYLRGDVLDTFDGKQWSNARREKTVPIIPDRNRIFQIHPFPAHSQPLHVTLTLLNTSKNTLFTPGTPLQITAPFDRLELSKADEVHWTSTLTHPLRYQMLSLPDERMEAVPETPLLQSLYQRLPPLNLERTRGLVHQIASAGSAADRAHAMEKYLRAHYQYTLDFGAAVPANPIEAFLFERRKGFCIHFASALAVMLRLDGIPSRVIAGYYHGEWNSLAQQILFREKDAHAWVEAWTGDQWITLDPSPRDVPGEISGNPLLRWQLHIRQTWDYLGYQWNRLIVEYDMYAQLHALEKWRDRSDRLGGKWSAWWLRWRGRIQNSQRNSIPNKETPSNQTARGISWTAIFIGLGFVFMLMLWTILHPRADGGIPDFYRRFLRRMARAGIAKEAAETPQDFARRAARKLPQRARQIEETTQAYSRIRFGKK